MPAIMKITSRAQSIPGLDQVEELDQHQVGDQVQDQVHDQVEEEDKDEDSRRTGEIRTRRIMMLRTRAKQG